MLTRTVILMALSLTVASFASAEDRSSIDAAVTTKSGDARAWQYLVVHHSATTKGSVESIHRSHKARRDSEGNPWLGIGYHFVIGNGDGMADGQVSPTFRWKDQLTGAHAGSKLYNEFGIGICLIGNFENAAPTAKQTAQLQSLIKRLSRECDIEATNVVAHGDIRRTACPGKLFPRKQFLVADLRTAQLHTTRRIPLDGEPSNEPSCEDVVQTAETSSNWKESR